jgi:prepilin-type N-terminal cleavage/methylation domain-containing protein
MKGRSYSLEEHSLQANGFTLVEMAIVLVLVGILISVGASMIGPLTKRAKLSETRETINGSVEAVIGFAAPRNRLPDLTASPSTTSFWTNVRTRNDAWVRQLVYVFDNNLATSICNRTTTNITIRECNNAACTAPTVVNNVAFLVLSGGDNANNQSYGSLAISAPTTINTYPVGIQVDNYAGDFTRATDEYDDIAKWVPLSELQAKMGCIGCTAYEVWNDRVGTTYFRVNGLRCNVITTGTLIASIGPGGAINGYSDSNCTAPTAPSFMTYAVADTVERTAITSTSALRNCAVNFLGTDR